MVDFVIWEYEGIDAEVGPVSDDDVPRTSVCQSEPSPHASENNVLRYKTEILNQDAQREEKRSALMVPHVLLKPAVLRPPDHRKLTV